MIGKIIKQVKLLASDARWRGFYLQRRFMNPALRSAIASRVVAKMRPDVVHSLRAPEDIRSLKELNDMGISMLGEILTPAQCGELREYFSKCKVFDPYRSGFPEFYPDDNAVRHPDAHVAHHKNQDILLAPHLLDVANDPKILGIVSGFLGCKPTISTLSAWWSYSTGKGAQQAEFFHRDVDDWRFVKLFIYLTDVGLESGPHIYVKNSSNVNRLSQIRRFSDDEVAGAFGEENVMAISEKAGHGFLENTFGIHKGQPVAKGVRLLFQVVYGMSSLPYGPKEPVISWRELRRSDLDPWINRIYVK